MRTYVKNAWRANNIMDKYHIIINIILVLYLLYSSYTDIRTQRIPLKLSIIVGLCNTIINILCAHNIKVAIMTMIYGCIVGAVLLLLAFITKEDIGYGDGIVMLLIGLSTGIKRTFLICCLSFVLTAFYACLLLLYKKNRKLTIPFLPFICISYLIQLFLI